MVMKRHILLLLTANPINIIRPFKKGRGWGFELSKFSLKKRVQIFPINKEGLVKWEAILKWEGGTTYFYPNLL